MAITLTAIPEIASSDKIKKILRLWKATLDVAVTANSGDTGLTYATGTAAPTGTAPTVVGKIFVDTTNKVVWMSTGTSAGSDWKQLSN